MLGDTKEEIEFGLKMQHQIIYHFPIALHFTHMDNDMVTYGITKDDEIVHSVNDMIINTHHIVIIIIFPIHTKIQKTVTLPCKILSASCKFSLHCKQCAVQYKKGRFWELVKKLQKGLVHFGEIDKKKTQTHHYSLFKMYSNPVNVACHLQIFIKIYCLKH